MGGAGFAGNASLLRGRDRGEYLSSDPARQLNEQPTDPSCPGMNQAAMAGAKSESVGCQVVGRDALKHHCRGIHE